MPYLHLRKGKDNQTLHLSPFQIGHPYAVIEELFRDYSLGDLRRLMEDIRETCMTTEQSSFHRAERRADYLLFHRRMEILFEIVWIIALQREKARCRHMRNHSNH
ncbi:MAG TPA: hypothetical protein VHD83_26335 [Puia sp.]|nr:hypothetical protein [Puia sp.]